MGMANKGGGEKWAVGETLPSVIFQIGIGGSNITGCQFESGNIQTDMKY